MKAQDPREHDDWALLQQFLPSDLEQIAYEHGFNPNPPPHLKAKLSEFRGLFRLLLIHTGLDLSLVNTAALAPTLGLPEISDVALTKRLRKAPQWMAPILARLINENNQFEPIRWAGYRLLATDATHNSQDGACQVTHRVHYSLDLVSAVPKDVRPTDAKTGETFRYVTPQPNELYLGDQAYCSPPGLHHLSAGGAHALVRYNPHAAPLQDAQGQSVDLSRLLKKVRSGGVREWSLRLPYRDKHQKPLAEPIPVRLMIQNLGPGARRKALKSLRQEHGTQIPARARQTAGFILLLSTVPQERLTARALLRLYRMRWSVELKIKEDKSLWDLSKLPTRVPSSGLARMMGKLILEQLWSRVLLSCAPPRAEATQQLR